MRYVYKSTILAFLFLLITGVSQAQTARSSFSLSKIDPAVVREFQRAWRLSYNGLSEVEGVVLLFANADGSYRAETLGRTNERRRVTFIWKPDIIALVHTHPKGCKPEPHGHDIALADRFGVPVFTITLKGMFMYDPITQAIRKIKDGLDWLQPGSWEPRNDIATREDSRPQGKALTPGAMTIITRR